jgi:BASS family bile acid:Na+ symporter
MIQALLLAPLDYVGRHATKFLFGGVLVGLAVPPLAALLRPGLVVFLLLPLTMALMRLDWSAFHAYARRPLLVLPMVVFLLLACPLVVFAVLEPLGLPRPLMEAIVLMAAAPPITGTVAISLILGLDAALAVIVMVIATALVPFTLPPLALMLLDIEIQMSLLEFMGRLALMVGVAFGGALLVRWRVKPEWLRENSRLIDGSSVVALVLFAIAIMDGVATKLMAQPGYVILATVSAFIANLLLQALGYVVGRHIFRLGQAAALTLGILTGNCNMGLVMVSLADRAVFDMVVFFAMGQLPMYMLPGLLQPVYRKLAARPVRR